jgi:predicted nucleic-acid-binding protein
VIGLDTNVVVRYLAQDDARQAAIATRLIEGSLSANERGFISIVTLAEIVRVMCSNYDASRASVAEIVEGLLTAPRLMMERADVLWRALNAYRDSKADFSDAVMAELGSAAGCSKTVTFDRQAVAHPGYRSVCGTRPSQRNSQPSCPVS